MSLLAPPRRSPLQGRSAAAPSQPAPATKSHDQPRTERNRVVDLVRAVALLVVVLGHWTLAIAELRGGRLRTAHLLAEVPQAQWATLFGQVMPLFFVVGGYANAASLASARRTGTSPTRWIRQRAVRLLLPVLPLAVVWTAVLAIMTPLFGSGAVDAARAAFVPLWFLGVYLLVIALAPLTLRLHERFGWRVPVVLFVGAALVEVAQRAGVPVLGWSGFLLVWGGLHQLGYAWFDGDMRPGRRAVLLLAGGAAALAVLIATDVEPLSMIAVPGAARGNTSPPTAAIVALGLAQTGALLLVQTRLARWLARPRVWTAVRVAGATSMTVYLWHMTVLVLVVLGLVLTGVFPAAAVGSWAWWGLRPVWLAALVAVLVPVVMLVLPLERRTARRAGQADDGTVRATLTGVVLAAAALAVTAATGLGALVGPVWPIVVTVALGGATLLVGALPRSRGRRARQRGGAA